MTTLTTTPSWPPLDTARFQIVTALSRPDLWSYMMSATGPQPLTKCWPRWMRSHVGSRFGSKLGDLAGSMAEFQFLVLDLTQRAPERPELEKLVGVAQAIPFHWEGLDSGDAAVVEVALGKLPDDGPAGALYVGTLQAWRREKEGEEWKPRGGESGGGGGKKLRFEDLEFEDGEREREAEKEIASHPPNALSALQIAVDAEYRQFGLADILIEQFRTAARESGLSCLVVPVRPTRKHEYPLVSMDDYLTWRHTSPSRGGQLDEGEGGDGGFLPFDSWLRKHVRHGARVVKVCPDAHVQEGDPEYWRRLAGVDVDVALNGLEPLESHPDLGPGFEVLLPGGLVPLKCYPRVGRCVYREPNVWVYHALK